MSQVSSAPVPGWKQLGEMLRVRRGHRTYKEVAPLLGLKDPVTLRKWERAERRIQPSRWQAVAMFLEVDLTTVVRLLGDPSDAVVHRLRTRPAGSEEAVQRDAYVDRYIELLFEGLADGKAESPTWAHTARALGELLGVTWPQDWDAKHAE